MRLLIADVVWRSRWRVALLCPALIAYLGLAAVSGDPTPVFWASMSVAFGLGPLTLWLAPRSIWYLPVARTDVWRAGWLVATAGTTLLTTAVKLIALLVPQVRESFGLASAALSSVYDFAYAGVGCALVIFATRPQPDSGPSRLLSHLLKGLADAALPLGFSTMILANFSVRGILPTQWTDLTARSAAVLVTALGVAVASYFHSPTPLTPSNRLARRPREKTGTARFELGGLSGLPRLIVHEAAWTLMITGCLVAGSVLFVIVAAVLAQAPEGIAGLLRSVFLRLDGSVPQARASGIEAFVLLFVFATFSGSLTGRFPTMIRHLRVLPLGTARLNALLIAWPVATWLTAWTALLALHFLVLGRSAIAYHTDELLALIGVSAIVQATMLRFSGFLKVLVFVPLTLIVPLVLFLDAPSPAAFVGVGLGGLAVAMVLNHRSLARRSTYTAAGPAVGGVQMF